MSDDSGARLRELYESQGGVGAVFSTKVAHYVASRPNYPLRCSSACRGSACCHRMRRWPTSVPVPGC